MTVAYPRQISLKLDNALLAALEKASGEAGENVSAFSRRRLREALGLPPEAPTISVDRAPKSTRAEFTRPWASPANVADALCVRLRGLPVGTSEEIRARAARPERPRFAVD